MADTAAGRRKTGRTARETRILSSLQDLLSTPLGMIFPRQPLPPNARRWAILLIVGIFGVLITGWVTRSLSGVEQERLELRFQSAAQARANEVVDQLRQPLDDLATLQRLFASVERVDWPSFRTFTAPMLSQPGVRSYNWSPRVAAADRAAFERNGKKLWGEQFSITDRDGAGRPLTAAAREQYFPLLYSVPEELGHASVGFDIYAIAARRQLIDQAIAGNRPTASAIGPLAVVPERSDFTLLIAPVYQHDRPPDLREARSGDVSGIVVIVLNVGKMIASANGALSDIGFNLRLVDLKQPSEKSPLAVWNSRLPGVDAATSEASLRYAKSVDLASHAWSVEVEATPAWIELNRSRGLYLVPLFGLLLTALLLLYLRVLLGRSALADWLELSHEDNLRQRQKSEAWANKLSMAVEQNPASIYITDLSVKIEYVIE